jgi:hypothetical protein
LFTLGIHSIQSYALTGAHADEFDVDFTVVNIPYLIVRSSLDRQRLPSYSLTLIASDHTEHVHARSHTIELNIEILFANASMPMFVQSLYSIDVREDTPIGMILLTVAAITENDNRIFYECLDRSPFIVDSLTGDIRLNNMLDYERQSSYQLTVKASTDAIPAYATVFIRIIDVNDNPVSIRMIMDGEPKRTKHVQH